MQKEEYLKYVEQTTKRADIKKTLLFSFLCGGLICALGEALRLFFLNFSLNEKDSIVNTVNGKFNGTRVTV